jgi:DNA recombination protein RmuC
VDELGKHLKAYEDYMGRLGSALGTTVNHYNAAYKELGKVDKDVTRITGDSPGLESVLLEKPNIEA